MTSKNNTNITVLLIYVDTSNTKRIKSFSDCERKLILCFYFFVMYFKTVSFGWGRVLVRTTYMANGSTKYLSHLSYEDANHKSLNINFYMQIIRIYILSSVLQSRDAKCLMIYLKSITMTSWQGNAFCIICPLWGQSNIKLDMSTARRRLKSPQLLYGPRQEMDDFRPEEEHWSQKQTLQKIKIKTNGQ